MAGSSEKDLRFFSIVGLADMVVEVYGYGKWMFGSDGEKMDLAKLAESGRLGAVTKLRVSWYRSVCQGV